MIHHLLLEGAMEGALGLGLDVVDTAARLQGAGRAPVRTLAQRVVSVDGRSVPSVQRRRLAVDGALRPQDVRRGDVVLVPGLFATKDSSVARLLARDDTRAALPLLRAAAARGAVLAASCSATFLLASAGVLDGGEATTTWWLAPFFARRFPAVTLRVDRMVVEGAGGRALTAGSAFAHADLALAVVARLTTPALASLAARYLVLDARTSQARYMVMDHLRSFDPVLERVEAFVAAHLERQVTLAELARAAGTSPRTLARRLATSLGTTPQRFVQRVRVARATHLLETTRASVEEVAAHVGYADAAAFRRAYRRHTGESPRGRRAGGAAGR